MGYYHYWSEEVLPIEVLRAAIGGERVIVNRGGVRRGQAFGRARREENPQEG